MKLKQLIQLHIHPVTSSVRLKSKAPAEFDRYKGMTGTVLANQGIFTTVRFGQVSVSVNTGHLERA